MTKQNLEKDKIEEQVCTDKHCPVHGSITIRGREFIGEVAKISSLKTVMVEWVRLYYLPKYQRYEKRKSRKAVHNPGCIEIKLGDRVRIAECRPISKTKNFVIMERL